MEFWGGSPLLRSQIVTSTLAMTMVQIAMAKFCCVGKLRIGLDA
jgi:hypothetical protein